MVNTWIIYGYGWYTLWQFKIASEHGWKWPCIVHFPIKHGDFPWLGSITSTRGYQFALHGIKPSKRCLNTMMFSCNDRLKLKWWILPFSILLWGQIQYQQYKVGILWVCPTILGRYTNFIQFAVLILFLKVLKKTLNGKIWGSGIWVQHVARASPLEESPLPESLIWRLLHPARGIWMIH